MRILFLDDDANRTKYFKMFLPVKTAKYVFAETAKEAIDALDDTSWEPFEVAFLDHDLGGEIFVTKVEETGYEVALHIAEMPADRRPYQVFIHTNNPDGAKRMQQALKGKVQDLQIVPFNDLMDFLSKRKE